MPEETTAAGADPFGGMNEVKIEYNNIKFGKVGDWFKGTLCDNTKQMKNQLSQVGEMQTVFEFKAHGGSLHQIIEKKVQDNATEVRKGEFYSFISGKQAILSQMKKAKIGQVIGLRFAEEIKNKQPGFDATKVIKVFLGEMDPEYQGESAGDM